MKKVVPLVKCLCKLHNFYIDNNSKTIPQNLKSVTKFLCLHDSIGYDDNGCPIGLLHGGEHQDDTHTHTCHAGFNINIELPREKMMRIVVNGAFKRLDRKAF